MSKINTLLNWTIIILGIILIICIIILPKEDCDVCSFDGKNGGDWFESYSRKCLQKYTSFQGNPNIPTLNLSNLSIQS